MTLTKKKKVKDLKELKHGLRDLLKIKSEYEKMEDHSVGLLHNFDELVDSYENAIVNIVMED